MDRYRHLHVTSTSPPVPPAAGGEKQRARGERGEEGQRRGPADRTLLGFGFGLGLGLGFGFGVGFGVGFGFGFGFGFGLGLPWAAR